LSSCSRTRSEAARIFRRIAASATLAVSATSSSLATVIEMRSSMNLFGCSVSKR